MSTGEYPSELIDPPERRVKHMAVGEAAAIPFYCLYVRPNRKIYVPTDQRLSESSLYAMVKIERLRKGFRLYLPENWSERVKIERKGYLRLPWRWLLGIRPVVEVELNKSF